MSIDAIIDEDPLTRGNIVSQVCNELKLNGDVTTSDGFSFDCKELHFILSVVACEDVDPNVRLKALQAPHISPWALRFALRDKDTIIRKQASGLILQRWLVPSDKGDADDNSSVISTQDIIEMLEVVRMEPEPQHIVPTLRKIQETFETCMEEGVMHIDGVNEIVEQMRKLCMHYDEQVRLETVNAILAMATAFAKAKAYRDEILSIVLILHGMIRDRASGIACRSAESLLQLDSSPGLRGELGVQLHREDVIALLGLYGGRGGTKTNQEAQVVHEIFNKFTFHCYEGYAMAVTFLCRRLWDNLDDSLLSHGEDIKGCLEEIRRRQPHFDVVFHLPVMAHSNKIERENEAE